MLRRQHLRLIAAVSGAIGGILVTTTPAWADPYGGASCHESPTPQCRVVAGDRPVPGENPPQPPINEGRPAQSVTRPNQQPDNVPGVRPGCYFREADGSELPRRRLPDCGFPPAAPAPADPYALAQEAVSRLQLPAVRTGASPTGVKLVRLPVWLWVSRDSWQTQTATASVPALTVTATARPVAVSWSMGDGGWLTCHSRGTPWTPARGGAAASPDCGYIYDSSSAGAPSTRYTVRATIRWRISWAGGPYSGTEPDLFASARRLVGRSPNRKPSSGSHRSRAHSATHSHGPHVGSILAWRFCCRKAQRRRRRVGQFMNR